MPVHVRDLKLGQCVTYRNSERVIVQIDKEKDLVWLATVPEWCDDTETGWKAAQKRQPVPVNKVTP